MSIVSIVVFLGILVADQLPRHAPEQALGPHRATRSTACRIRRSRSCKELKEPVQVTVFERNDRQDAHKDRLRGIPVPDHAAHDRVRRSRSRADARRQRRRSRRCRRSCSSTRAAPSASRSIERTGPDQRADQGGHRRGAQGLLHAGPRREGHRVHRSRAVSAPRVEAMKQDNFAVEPLVLIQQKTVPDDATIVVIAGPTTDFFPPEIEALNAYVAKGGKVMVMLDPLLKGPAQPLLHAVPRRLGHPAPATTSCSTRAAWARCSAPTRRCRWRRSIRRIRSPRASASITAYPMARSMAPIEGGSNGHIAQPLVNTSPQSWSEADLAALSTGKARSRVQRRQGRQAGTDHARRRRVGAGDRDAAAAAGNGSRRPRPTPSASPKRASSRSATRTSPPTWRSASPATATSS